MKAHEAKSTRGILASYYRLHLSAKMSLSERQKRRHILQYLANNYSAFLTEISLQLQSEAVLFFWKK